MAFWKDAWARSAAPGAAGAPGTPGDPFAWMPTPEQVKRLQGSFMDAMAQASDQYMRSPQFLEALKSSLDSGLQARRQMEEFVRRHMGDGLREGAAAPFATPPQAAAEVLSALNEIESRLSARIDALAARLDAAVGGARPATSSPEPDGGTRPRRPAKA